MAKQLPFLFVLAIALSPAMGYICSDDRVPMDGFEAHGCFCGTQNISMEHPHLMITYYTAFEGCHEPNNVDITIECAFLESEAGYLKSRFNRTSLSEIPMTIAMTNQTLVYENVTCLLLSGNNISSITRQQMKQFPRLKRIYLDNNALTHIDSDAFDSNPHLTVIDLEGAELTEFPNVTGAINLEQLLLGHNRIEAIPNISSLTALRTLDLQYNHIQELVPAHFRGLRNVHTILLNHNRIEVLENNVFQDMQTLTRLELEYNSIHRIEESAFNGTKLHDLMLSGNRFSKLPSSDLRYYLVNLYVEGVVTLINFPPPYNENGDLTFPEIEILKLVYATHCCWYKYYYIHELSQPVHIDFTGKRRRESPTSFTSSEIPITCTPPPDPFHPCYDIIDIIYMRIVIWLIITVAVCGNVLVMIVLIFSMVKKRTATVPQILITNLAAADFCLAVYLIFLGAADLDTAGQYEDVAFNWERGAACKTAGFFAVFSSVASICLLALITFERMTTIAFSYTGKRFMTIPKTVVALVFVWLVAFIFGILPAVGVSSYGKVCICLPIDASTSWDKGYIISLLIFTGTVCFFILICYVVLFIRVKKTTSSLSGRQELRIAFKMSALVLTDFLIWTPIAVIGLTGVLRGESLIGLQASKYILIFIFPINCWVNPLLYSILQNGFRNQFCDMFAYCGLCKEYHQRRKARAQGLTYNAPTNGRRLRIGSITSTSTYTSFLNLFNKRSSVTSIGSNEAAQMQNLTKKKHRSHSSTSSDQQSIKEGRVLTPIHESTAQESATQEADTVFSSETSHPTNDSSTTQLLSTRNNSGSIEDSSDSGVVHSDQDNGETLNGSPPNTSNDQALVFNVSISPNNCDVESTEC